MDMYSQEIVTVGLNPLITHFKFQLKWVIGKNGYDKKCVNEYVEKH